LAVLGGALTVNPESDAPKKLLLVSAASSKPLRPGDSFRVVRTGVLFGVAVLGVIFLRNSTYAAPAAGLKLLSLWRGTANDTNSPRVLESTEEAAW
jgi:hypothetical protein